MQLKERYESVHAAILEGPNAELQKLIDSGLAWKLEGFVGRSAMDALRAGACVLPPDIHCDSYGCPVPSYSIVVDGSQGSVALAEQFLDEE